MTAVPETPGQAQLRAAVLEKIRDLTDCNSDDGCPRCNQHVDEIFAAAGAQPAQAAPGHLMVMRGTIALRDAEIEQLRRGCGVHPGIPGYEHPECGFHWHGKDGTDVPLDASREPVCPRCALTAQAPPKWSPHDLADQAIGLFLEFRDQHAYDEPSARSAAALEVAEGAAVTDEEIGTEQDARDVAAEDGDTDWCQPTL